VVLFALYLLLLLGGAEVAGKGTRSMLLLDGGAKVLALVGTALLLRAAGGFRDPGPAPAGRAMAAGVLSGWAFLPVMAGTVLLQEQAWKALGWTLEEQNLVKVAREGAPLDLALVGFFAVVVAPVFEETLFRVCLYSGLRALAGPGTAAVVSAALFALVHGTAVAYPVTFLLGLCLADLRERTGGRSAPIAMHACYNSVQMAGILALRAAGGGTAGG
jgi:membrane protease YdiL (CAAX protease family)